MKHHLEIILPALLVAAVACVTPAAAPPANDADAGITVTTASACSRACLHLRDLGCPEGRSPTCAKACTGRAELFDTPAACWASASTPAEARACGGLACAR